MRRGAFTLIEVMVVVALLGLLTGATAWSLAEDARRGFRVNTAGQIIHADRMARLAAQRLGKACVLKFDLESQRIQRVVGDEGYGDGASPALLIPARCRIDRVLIPQAPGSLEGASGETVGVAADSGVLEVAYSTGGRSVSYALRLVFEEGEIGHESEGDGWLIFSGLTGQVTLSNEDEIGNVFTMLAAGWPDAR